MLRVDELFVDGVANAGSVFRRGNEVVRPSGPHSVAVHALLKHLRTVGFTGAPDAIALQGSIERVSYIPGSVPAPPYSDKYLADDTLERIAQMQRSYHDAVRTFVPPPNSAWNTSLADPNGAGIVGHNDLGPGNVVFTDGKPAGFIDFDFAAPGRALWDIARTARAWVPLDDPDSAVAYGLGGLNPFGRLRIFCESYGLTRAERLDLVDLIELCNDATEAYVRSQVVAGKPAYVSMWTEYGLEVLYQKRRQWIQSNKFSFQIALG